MSSTFTHHTATVQRDIPAVTVPYGEPATIAEGAEVVVMQQLGGSITVRSRDGWLLRVEAEHADALGLDAEDLAPAHDPDVPFSMELVTAAMREVFDPEIPINIVDLGLVYRCDEIVDSLDRRCIDIDLSMTAPGCGMGDVLRADVERVVSAIPGVDAALVTLVWDPPWSFERLSEEARLQLGML